VYGPVSLLAIPRRHNVVHNNNNNGTAAAATIIPPPPYIGGEVKNTNDIVVWHSGGAGRSTGDNDATAVTVTQQGETQLFQFPSNFTGEADGDADDDDDDDDTPRLRSHQLGSRTWTVAAAPILVVVTDGNNNVKNGTTTIATTSTELYFGTSEGRIRGWRDDRPFELTPNYDLPFGQKNDDVPTWLKLYEDRFYVATANNYFYALNKTSRAVLWELSPPSLSSLNNNNKETSNNNNTNTTGSSNNNNTSATNNDKNNNNNNDNNNELVASPVLSDDGNRVYLAIGRRMYCKDARTGVNLWTVPVQPSDGSAIVAHFAVSNTFLYYVGSERNIVTALRIAQEAGPTARPSMTPTLAPSVSPAPKVAPANHYDPPSSGNNNKQVILIAIGAIATVVVLAALLCVAKRKVLGGGDGDDGVDTEYDFGRPPPQQQSLFAPDRPRPVPQSHQQLRGAMAEARQHPNPGQRGGAPVFPQQPMSQPQPYSRGPYPYPAAAAPAPRVPPSSGPSSPSLAQPPVLQQKPIRYKYDPTKV
jgi:hypothetical protein